MNELDKTTYSRALLTQNAELCAAIEDKTLKENCGATIKEQKLKEEAVTAKDASKCEKLTIENLKKACGIEIKKLSDEEKKVQEQQVYTDNQNKLLNEITQTGDQKKCSQLSSDYWINICKDIIGLEKHDKTP